MKICAPLRPDDFWTTNVNISLSLPSPSGELSSLAVSMSSQPQLSTAKNISSPQLLIGGDIKEYSRSFRILMVCGVTMEGACVESNATLVDIWIILLKLGEAL